MFTERMIFLLQDVPLKSLLIFLIAGLACLLLRRASAATRHALWLLVLAALLCLPLFCALLPRWSAPVLPATPRSHSAAIPAAPVIALPSQAVVPGKGADIPAMTGPLLPPAPVMQPPPARLPLTVWVCLLWLLGTLLVLGRTLIGLAAASRLVRHCRPIMGGVLVEASEQAQNSLSLPRALSLRVGPVAVPMTCGVRHPIILLPESAPEWPAGRLRAVLLHEAAHVKRLDWPATLLAQCVCALYWFHPLVWLAAARLRAEAESACDDLVLTCGVPAPDYAAHLLEIVRGLTSRRPAMPGTVAMAHRQEVSTRLRAILNGHYPTGSPPRRTLALSGTLVLALLVPLAALYPAAARPTQPPLQKTVQTLSWVQTTDVTSASVHTTSRDVVWTERNPPAISIIDTRLPNEVAMTNQYGVYGRMLSGPRTVKWRQGPGNGKIMVAQTVNGAFRLITSFASTLTQHPPTKIGSTRLSYSPWQKKQVSFDGKPAWLYTRQTNIIIPNSHKGMDQHVSHIQDWVDPLSGHLLMSVNSVKGTFGGKPQSVTIVMRDIRVNPMPPPGVFDSGPPPASGAPDSSWEDFTPTQMAVLVTETKPWALTLPDGVRVQVLTVNAQDRKGNVARSWTPDGKLRWQSKAINPVRGNFLFMCRITVPPQLQKFAGQIGFGKATDQYYTTYGFPPLQQPQIFDFPIPFPSRQSAGTLKAHVTLEPGTTLIAGPPTTGATRRLPTGELASISPATTTTWKEGFPSHPMKVMEVAVTVPARFVHDFIGYDLEAIGHNGQPLHIAHGLGPLQPAVHKGIARLVYDCRASELPLSQVKEFRFTVRPVYTAVIRNIALRPDMQKAQG